MTSQQQTFTPLLSIAIAAVLAANSSAVIINVPGDYATIQAAIDAATSGDEIVVAPGTYNETINLLGKAITLRSSDGPEVTTIDAQGSGTVVSCISFEGPATVVDGFTITGGLQSTTGGGWFNQNSSPTVTNCVFSENSTNGCCGGGMRNSNSSPTLIDCTFSGNSTTSGGGGMFNSVNSFPVVTNCMFAGNTAGEGGGMYNPQGAYPVITDSLFCENTPDNIYGPYDDNGGNDFAGDCDLFLDCNGNGIYDWIEIKKGLVQDVNNNGIPDECECLADLSGGGVVDAFDLAIMLGAWCSAVNDPNPPSPPCENCTQANLDLADIAGPAQGPPDGCVDSNDLTKLLGAWGPCG